MDNQNSELNPTPLSGNEQTMFTQSTQAPLVKDDIIKIIREYNKSTGFSDRKLTDTPSDALQVVPRKYVTNNGTSANRPTASVVGQPYLDMTLASGRGKPIWWNGTGFIDATGTYV